MVKPASAAGHWNLSAWLLPLLLTAAVYIPTSGFRGVIDYDEGHYSQVALQMLARGDWVTPYDDGVRFLEKPPLMYWLTAASLRLFGKSEFALRFPSALAVIALVWIVMIIARRAADTRAAVMAGLCTSFSVGTYLFTREALHDVWLVLFLTLAMYAFLEWYRDPARSLVPSLLFYAALAGAVLTKSLVGVAFPVGIVLLFFLMRRERPKWRTLHLLPGCALFLVLAVPWHLLAAMRNQGFLQSFFFNEQFLRFVGRHDPPIVWSVPLLTFWALNLVWFLPWTPFVPAAIMAWRRSVDPCRRVLSDLAVAWAVVILGFFSVSGRLEHYFFPAIPALALLVGLALADTGESHAVRWGFRSLAALGLAVLAAGLGFVIWLAAGHTVHTTGNVRSDVISETDFSILEEMPVAIQSRLAEPAAVTIVSMALGFLCAGIMERRRRRMASVLSVTAFMIVICGMTQWSLVICEDMISSKKFGLAVAREALPGDHVVVVGDYESANAISFYQPLHVEVFDGMAYSLIPGTKFSDAPKIVLTRDEFNALWNSSKRVYALLPQVKQRELSLKGICMLQVMDRILLKNR